MHRALKLHPQSRCAAVTRIGVDITRTRADSLALRYVVTGRIGDLRMSAATAPTRADELWRHTCFEAFVRVPPGAAYYEFNFAPSTEWAAYRFDGYRSGMRRASEIGDPRIETESAGDLYEMRASVTLPGPPGAADWQLGLAAVIEEMGGNRSYWALAHPEGKPDFHHDAAFAYILPAAGQP